MNRWIVLAGFLLLCLGGGSLIGVATAPGPWYESLQKPFFTPPDWLFGPVWSLLYVLIGIAGWRVWRIAPRSGAMALWWGQLALNFVWSPTFFALGQPGLAFVVILVLLAAIIGFILASRRLDTAAAWLFVPYAAWVGFATLLNAGIWWLN